VLILSLEIMTYYPKAVVCCLLDFLVSSGLSNVDHVLTSYHLGVPNHYIVPYTPGHFLITPRIKPLRMLKAPIRR
jgi:hypothetical protein